jgi:dipeptidase
MADTHEAYILETAGRKWAVRQIEDVGSISNMLGITSNWTRCSLPASQGEKLDWAGTYALPEIPPNLGAPDRQAFTYNGLVAGKGQISVKTMFNIMRHHSQGYHPHG